jgi:ribosome-associated protein
MPAPKKKTPFKKPAGKSASKPASKPAAKSRGPVKSRGPAKPVRRPVAKVKGSKAKTRSETPKLAAVKAVPTKVPAFVVAVVKALDDKKALGIRVLELGQLSSVADYMVIATGNSDPHLRALRIEVEKALDDVGSPARASESQSESGWTVVDGFNVLVHIFRPEVRESYSMESLWKDGLDVPVAAILKA